jgi:spore coat-associated protein N
MSRLTTLIKRPKRTLVALVVVSLAVAVAIGSGAAFTSQSSNPGNSFTSGVLKQGNNKNGQAVATLTNMLPGDEKTGSITLSNDGNRTGTFQFSKSGETNTAGTDQEACSGVDGGSATCSALGGALKVEVKDGSTVVYDDVVTGLSISDFNLAPSASRTLDFRFYLPSATGNAYQGGSYGAQYDWNEVQPNPAVTP